MRDNVVYTEPAREQGGCSFWLLLSALMVATVWWSPWFPVLIAAVVGGLWLSWKQPLTVLLGLAVWLPVEPFLLKFASDSVYLLARYASELAVYAVAGFTLLGLYTGRYRFRSTGVEWPFMLFAGTMVCATVLHFLPVGEAVLGARQLLRFLILFFVMVWLSPPREWIKRLVWVWLGMAIFQACIGLAQVGTGGVFDAFLLPSGRHTLGEIQLTEGVDQFWEPGQRVFGTMGRYDRFGTFLTFAFLVALAFFYEMPKKERWKFWAFACPVLLGIVWSYSRSAWIGLAVGVAAIAWVKRDKRVLLGGGALLVGAILAVLLSGLTKNALDVGSQTLAERFAEGFSFYRFYGEYLGFGRVFWMVQTPLTILPYSWISFFFGWGPGQFGGGAVAALHNTRAYDATNLPFGIYGTEGYVDNNWMSILGENGVVGFGAFLWLFLALVFFAYRRARASRDSFTRPVCLASFATLLALAVHSGLATFFEIRTLAPFVWMLAGCAFVLASPKTPYAHSSNQ